jgi:hypothetical protein
MSILADHAAEKESCVPAGRRAADSPTRRSACWRTSSNGCIESSSSRKTPQKDLIPAILVTSDSGVNATSES